ncbi:diguanylate cyclase [uncultured Sphaerotilus sp.]|uniref:diguanylate cyclase domain-containing protein n=1 Tax=uncultured Sphaerotilus sp. TaxID=474984 RepID=UPI0030CA14C5
MTRRFWSGWSLRTKLITAGGLVQLAAAAVLQLGSIGLLERTLSAQAADQTRQVGTLLDQAIAAPLAQRDYATLQQTLDLVRNDDPIRYLVLLDHRGKLVVASGWEPNRPLPPRDQGRIDLDRADTTLHLEVPIVLADQPLGRIELGLSTERLREARHAFLRHSMGIAAAALALSMAVFAAIAFAITRHLARLARASQQVAAGDFDVSVPVVTQDEIGRLGASFNTMAATIKQRVAALEDSEHRQHLHLIAAREEQARLTTLLGAMRHGILFVDAQQQILYANAAFSQLWAVPGVLAGQRLDDLVPLLHHRVIAADALHLDAMRQTTGRRDATVRELRTVDGRLLVQRCQSVTEGNAASGCLWFHEDVTLERQAQQHAWEAVHDALTGLLNRRGLHEALERTLSLAARDRAPVALMFIDLDDFKRANDLGGHRTGDEILVAVARALSAQTRPGDTTARLGGDEFAVLCPGLPAEPAGHLAGRLVAAVEHLRFTTASGLVLQVGCSIGIALSPLHARSGEELVACADGAMYRAKQRGKNGWVLCGDEPTQTRSTISAIP